MTLDLSWNYAKLGYLVDSSPNLSLPAAKTNIIAVSAKTLYSETCRHYYMAPWTQEELEVCRSAVRDLERISLSFLKELYEIMSGVPGYVLERPNSALRHNQSAHRLAKEKLPSAPPTAERRS
ncbi:hypothetical protein EDD21DRAFT_420153 [Dissophora ornata]|nr:hypothetical protein EDD21DRAFT_420153 [Dissophora ornata]